MYNRQVQSIFFSTSPACHRALQLHNSWSVFMVTARLTNAVVLEDNSPVLEPHQLQIKANIFEFFIKVIKLSLIQMYAFSGDLEIVNLQTNACFAIQL